MVGSLQKFEKLREFSPPFSHTG